SGVKVRDPIPAGCVYVPGSTQLNGQPVDDVGNESKVLTGLLVSTPGQDPGVIQPGQQGVAVVSFQTRVSATVLESTTISNIATLSADGVAPVTVGPASLTVGQSASLKRFDKIAQVIDLNGSGVADPGEELLYELRVRNDGASAAEQVVVEDPLPAGSAYVATSLALDGNAITDAKDADEGSFDGKKVVVKIGTIEAGKTRLVTFRVTALSAGVISNQAIVRAKGLADEPSDSDGDDTNGDQPTRTPVGITGPTLQVTKQVQDQNGGEVSPGDWLRYTIQVRNEGNSEVKDIALVDVIPAGLTGAPEDVLVPNGSQWTLLAAEGSDIGTMRVTGVNVRDGETVTVSFRIRVRKDAADSLSICNVVDAQLVTPVGDRRRRATTISSEPACVTVGVASGQSVIKGFVFEDVGALDESFDPKTDAVFGGWQVLVSPLEGQEGPSISSVTEPDGSFRLPQVSAGKRRIRVISPMGTVFLDTQFDVSAQNATRIDLALKPTGRLYDAKRGSVVSGLRMFLHYDATDPIAPNTLVAEDALPAGQQGQRVGESGAYLFTAPEGRAYRISLAAGGLPWAFPSTERPPQQAIAVLNGAGLVSPQALPSANLKSDYYLRFTRQAALGKTDDPDNAPAPRHNHIPVDALQDAISIGIHLSKARAQVGEVVHATITIINKSNAAIAANPQTGLGGGVLRNLVPRGLAFVGGSLRLSMKGQSDESPRTISAWSTVGPIIEIKRTSEDGPDPLGLNLPVGGRLTARFQLVVSATADIGTTLSARAQLFDTSGTPLTKAAKAKLLVQPDALMDRGTILGKVFCDDDGDGRQSGKEVGLGAARVYIDTGHYSETDRAGRYHLMDIAPGNHLIKLDVNTLAPGTTLTTDVKRVVWVTRGLGQKINFGVRCKLQRLRADEVVVKKIKRPEAPKPKPGPGVVHVRTALQDLGVEIDGRQLPNARVRSMLLTDDAIRPSPLPIATTPVNLVFGAPLKIAVESEGALTEYSVTLREISNTGGLGVTVMSWRYRGSPPPLVVQPLPLDTVTPGRRYAVRVRARNRYGASVWGVWMPLVVPLGGVKQSAWSLTKLGRWTQLNGRRVEFDSKGRSDVWIERPKSGRLIIGLQRRSGEGRNAYVSIRAKLSKSQLRPPKVDDRDDAKTLIGSLIEDQSAAMSTEVSKTVLDLVKAPLKAKAMEPEPDTINAPLTSPELKGPEPINPEDKSDTAPNTDASQPLPRVDDVAKIAGRDRVGVVDDTSSAAAKAPVTPKTPVTPKAPVASSVKAMPPVIRPKMSMLLPGQVQPKAAPKPANKPSESETSAAPKTTVVTPAPKATKIEMIPVTFDLTQSDGVRLGGMLLKSVSRPTEVRAPVGPVGLVGGALMHELVIQVRGVPQNASSAAMVMMDRRGRVRLRTPLSPPVPETFVWDPESIPHEPLQAGVYGVAFEVMVKSASGEAGWRTAPTRLELSSTSQRLIPRGEPDKVVRATLFANDGTPTPSMREWVTKTASIIRERSDRIAVVTVHSVAKQAKARTNSAGASIRALLVHNDVNPKRLLVLSVGSAIKDPDPQGTALGDDRVEVRFMSTRVAATSGAQGVSYPVEPGYWVNGQALKGGDDGKAPTTVKVPRGRATLIEAQSIEGAASLWKRSFGQPAGAPSASTSPQHKDSTLMSFGADLYERLGKSLIKPKASRSAKSKPSKDKVKDKVAPSKTDKAAPMSEQVTHTFKTVSVGQAGDTHAADLDVYLPSNDKPLGSRVIGIRGRTHKDNQLTINGRKVAVRKDGSFYVRHELPAGGGKVSIETKDQAGHVARLKRSYKVSGQALFLMAIADTALVQSGTRLQGMTDRTTVKAGPVQLHGRGAVYMKGRIQGKYLGFNNIRFTAHLDTSKNPDIEDFRSNLFDPDRFYPVYG
ncbi:MAG TPA: hypothetical protein DCQ06_02200, partial [Myxococcales bacterium]|nr:hypothetical protein [Myxococcales bacterium]